jgi:hypothetical protein
VSIPNQPIAKRPRGRPRMSADGLLFARHILLNLTNETYERLRREAEARRVTVTALARSRLLQSLTANGVGHDVASSAELKITCRGRSAMSTPMAASDRTAMGEAPNAASAHTATGEAPKAARDRGGIGHA